MSRHSWHHKAAAQVSAAALVLATAVLAPLGAMRTHAAPARAPITITYWMNNRPLAMGVIPAFERTHPGMKIHEVVVADLSKKLGKIFKAGRTSAPDALQMPYKELPTYLLTGKLLDLSQYGAGRLKDTYVPWAWGQVARGAHVYAIPVDSGPVAMMYRKDIFDRYHLAIPKTWAQYEREAIALHKAHPKIWMANSPVDEYDVEVFLWQAGATPFKVNGTTISVDWTSPAAMKVANYWYRLMKEKAVATLPSATPSWYRALDNGTFATWINASWAPPDIEALSKTSFGKWRVALMPQWSARDHASADYGGTSAVVTTFSKHPGAAATWVEWLGGSKMSQLLQLKNHNFPTLKSILNNPKEIAQPDPFFGGQMAYGVFAQAAKGVDTRWQWSPFHDYVAKQLYNDLAAAEAGKGTFARALHKLQRRIVAYARSRGFTVT